MALPPERMPVVAAEGGVGCGSQVCGVQADVLFVDGDGRDAVPIGIGSGVDGVAGLWWWRESKMVQWCRW